MIFSLILCGVVISYAIVCVFIDTFFEGLRGSKRSNYRILKITTDGVTIYKVQFRDIYPCFWDSITASESLAFGTYTNLEDAQKYIECQIEKSKQKRIRPKIKKEVIK